MRWHADLALIGALVSFVFWGVGTLFSAHPDGAILGFSGTMWMIWATAEKEARRREEVDSRWDDDDDEYYDDDEYGDRDVPEEDDVDQEDGCEGPYDQARDDDG